MRTYERFFTTKDLPWSQRKNDRTQKPDTVWNGNRDRSRILSIQFRLGLAASSRGGNPRSQGLQRQMGTRRCDELDDQGGKRNVLLAGKDLRSVVTVLASQ
jgi:hypothetical protein